MTSGELPGRGADPENRARALQSLLIEKGLLSTDLVDEVVSKYETDIGPIHGKRVVARAWTDSDYRDRLLSDSTATLEAEGHTGLDGVEIIVIENTDHLHNVMVCTLCSCFPWPVLGLPPTWYKQPGYRARMVKRPRETLREDFDLDLDDDIEIRVRDTSAEVRYMVLPRPPEGIENVPPEERPEYVSREAMIGVERLGDKHVREL